MTVKRTRARMVLALLGAGLLLGGGMVWAAEPGDESPFRPEPGALAPPEPALEVPLATGDLSAGCGEQCGAECGGCATCGAGGPVCCSCCYPGRVWFRADWLMWWTSGTRLPALITTSTNPDPPAEPPSEIGALGDPYTVITFGNRLVHNEGRPGYRLKLGYWLSGCRVRGFEGEYYDIGGASRDYDTGFSEGIPIFARPFYDVTPRIDGQEGRELDSYPDWLQGRKRVHTGDFFQSAGVWGLLNVVCVQPACAASTAEEYFALAKARANDCFRMEMIVGYRYYRLGDSVTINESLIAAGMPLIPVGSTWEIEDHFRALNEFHGGELGLVAGFHRGRWSLDFLARMALGNNHQTAWIDGQTVFTRPGEDPVTYDAGILALETNSGIYERDNFVVIPHFGVELDYLLRPHIRGFVGYNFVYWLNVTRAADLIDRAVNTEWVPGGAATPGPPLRPAFNNDDFPWRQTEFWAQGLNLGLECRF